jgi:hypothetical protein
MDGKFKEAGENVLNSLVPAGSQIRKTVQGLEKAAEDGADIYNTVKGAVFGKGAVGTGIVTGLANGNSAKAESGEWYEITEKNKLKRTDEDSAAYKGKVYGDWDYATKKYLSMTSDEIQKDREKGNWQGVAEYYKAVAYAENENDATEKDRAKAEQNYKYASVNQNFGNDLIKLYNETTLTDWRELAKTEPEVAEQLLAYDNALAAAGVAKKGNGEWEKAGEYDKNKYYAKKSSGSGGSGGSKKAAKWSIEAPSILYPTFTPSKREVNYNLGKGIVKGITTKKIEPAKVEALPRARAR